MNFPASSLPNSLIKITQKFQLTILCLENAKYVSNLNSTLALTMTSNTTTCCLLTEDTTNDFYFECHHTKLRDISRDFHIFVEKKNNCSW